MPPISPETPWAAAELLNEVKRSLSDDYLLVLFKSTSAHATQIATPSNFSWKSRCGCSGKYTSIPYKHSKPQLKSKSSLSFSSIIFTIGTTRASQRRFSRMAAQDTLADRFCICQYGSARTVVPLPRRSFGARRRDIAVRVCIR